MISIALLCGIPTGGRRVRSAAHYAKPSMIQPSIINRREARRGTANATDDKQVSVKLPV